MKKRWVKFVIWTGLISILTYLGFAAYNFVKLRRTLSAWDQALNASRSPSDAQKVAMWQSRFARADSDGKRALVETVSITKDLTAIPALQECLKGDDVWLKIHASEALYSMGDRSAYETLMTLVNCTDPAFQIMAGYTGKNPPEDLSLFKHGDVRSIRYLAARLLANNKEERAMPVLITIFREGPDPGLGEALATFQTQEVADLIFQQFQKRPFASAYIKAMAKLNDERAVPILLANYEAGDRRVQRSVDPRSDDAWEGAGMKREASLALLAFGRKDHLDYLLEEIKLGKRRQTAYDIADVGFKGALEPFLEILSSSDNPSVIRALGLSLAQLGFQDDARVLDTLLAAIERCPEKQRWGVSRVLVAYPDAKAQAVLQKYNADDVSGVNILRHRFQREGFAALKN